MVLLSSYREMDIERSPFSFHALDRNLPTVIVDDFPHDLEPKTRSARFPTDMLCGEEAISN